MDPTGSPEFDSPLPQLPKEIKEREDRRILELARIVDGRMNEVIQRGLVDDLHDHGYQVDDMGGLDGDGWYLYDSQDRAQDKTGKGGGFGYNVTRNPEGQLVHELQIDTHIDQRSQQAMEQLMQSLPHKDVDLNHPATIYTFGNDHIDKQVVVPADFQDDRPLGKRRDWMGDEIEAREAEIESLGEYETMGASLVTLRHALDQVLAEKA